MQTQTLDLSPSSFSQEAGQISLSEESLPQLSQTWRTFQKANSKADKVWCITVEPDGESLRIKQGTHGEELTESEPKRPGSKGLPGSRTYISAVDACEREVERLIRLQTQKGFCEVIAGKVTEASSPLIDFSRPFPADLLTPKPRTSISEKDLQKLHNEDRLLYTRKYDGMGLTLVHHTFGWCAYTLANHCVSDFFPKQLATLEKTKLKVGTVLKAEATIFKKDDPLKEDFNAIIARFSPTKDPKTTRELVMSGKIPEPSFVVYDILYHNGKELHDMPYAQRMSHWNKFPVARGGNGHILSAEFIPDLTPENWFERRLQANVEGWVAYDKQATLGKNALSYSQSPARPAGIFKLKPNTQEDVVIFAVRQVNGEYQSVFTKQRYPDYYPDTSIPVPNAGEWFYCGRVSLHRSPIISEEIDKLVKKSLIKVVPDNKTGESLPIDNSYGVTTVIEFFERQNSGKFRHPKFPEEFRFRVKGSGDYKAPGHCFAQTLVCAE